MKPIVYFMGNWWYCEDDHFEGHGTSPETAFQDYKENKDKHKFMPGIKTHVKPSSSVVFH